MTGRHLQAKVRSSTNGTTLMQPKPADHSLHCAACILVCAYSPWPAAERARSAALAECCGCVAVSAGRVSQQQV